MASGLRSRAENILALMLLVILFAPGGLWGMAARVVGGRGR